MNKIIASDKTPTITYSEIFKSIQGEGKYTGVPSVWLRFWLCNLSCGGFGQSNPQDPSTWKQAKADLIPIAEISNLEELPVFEYGCDSDYSRAKKYKHLMHTETVEEVAARLLALLPGNNWLHPKTGMTTDMCFTGGEPMMHQDRMVDLLEHFASLGKLPPRVTVETNGTQKLSVRLRQFILNNYKFTKGREWFWSYSPKLQSVSGEKQKRALKPEVVAEYEYASPAMQVKPVMGLLTEQWAELNEFLGELFTHTKRPLPVYVMAVGATEEEQEYIGASVCRLAADEGFYFSGRLHTHLFGNMIGT